MPICSICGAYYVRPPCPTCSDTERESRSRRVTGWFQRKKTQKSVEEPTQTTTLSTPTPPTTTSTSSDSVANSSYTVIAKISELGKQLEEKDQVIAQLEAKITEQEALIAKLQNEINELK